MNRILTLISQKELSVVEKILGDYCQGRQIRNVSLLMIGATEKSGKNNHDSTKGFGSVKFVLSTF